MFKKIRDGFSWRTLLKIVGLVALAAVLVYAVILVFALPDDKTSGSDTSVIEANVDVLETTQGTSLDETSEAAAQDAETAAGSDAASAESDSDDSTEDADSDAADADSETAETTETAEAAEDATAAQEETVQTGGSVDEILASMTIEEKIGQLFIVTPEALVNNAVSCVTSAGETTHNAILERPVGGVIFFRNNLETADQTTTMISNMQTYAVESCGIGMWIAVDEEGGDVARVASALGTTQFNSMEYYGTNGDADTVYQVGSQIAADISQFGFNLDFAPVADVNLNPENELGNRIFSSDAQVVSDMVASIVRGFQSSGQVSATLKHFPGLGAGDGNTHNSQTTIDRTYEELVAEEFVAFQGGIDAGVDFVMVGHQIMTAAGDGLPSDLSETVVTTWLRNTLGFQGVVVTDAQNMGAITNSYSASTAAVMSIQAGVDIILMPNDFDAAYNGIYQAVQDGSISEERIDASVRRILTAKQAHGLC